MKAEHEFVKKEDKYREQVVSNTGEIAIDRKSIQMKSKEQVNKKIFTFQ